MDPAAPKPRDPERTLLRTDLDPDPLVTLRAWLAAAVAADLPEPTAMTLATVDERARPDARIVLCKAIDDEGVVFYTNTRSAKGRQLDANPAASLVFAWLALQRQVRVRGRARRVTDAEADAYFASRPRNSQISAWASDQSAVIDDRPTLEATFAVVAARYGARDNDPPVPRPPYWTGYRVVPDSVEFWQGRESRLHDRLRHRRDGGGGEWIVERLSP